MISVVGMGGVGKTALALQLAAALKPAFPDAQIYLDLRGVTQEPVSSTEAMAHVVRSFYPDAGLPESPTELAALYRSALDGKRALHLMDNAADREQVEPLIPPRPNVLLLTSRFRFTLPGIRLEDLDELSPEDARALLLRIEPRIGDSADEMARLCGNLPLALRLAGGALAERPDLYPAVYLRKLADTRQQLDFVDASLTLSYELLDEDLRRRWRELAVFQGGFDARGAAAVWAVELETAEEILGRLVKSSMTDGENGRYKLHDLARVFAASRLEETEGEDARRRHAEHYLTVLSAAEELYEEGGESVLIGLWLHDVERGNIHAGQAWAAARAEGDELAAELCSLFALAGRHCLDLRQPRQERLRWLESALAAARRRGDRAAEGKILGNMGNAYADLGDARRALELYEQDVQIAREIGDRRSEGAALGNLGNAHSDLGNARHALELYEQNLAIAREIGDRASESRALGSLGNASMVLGEPRRAIEYYEQTLQLSRELGNRHHEGMALGNLGLAYTDLGDQQRAIGLYEQALEIAREIGDRRSEGHALAGVGLAYAALGDTRRAIEIHEQRLQIARDLADRRAEGHALNSLGNAYRDLGEPRRAIETLEQNLQITREIGDRLGESHALGGLADACEALGERRRAIELRQQELQIIREIGNRQKEAQTQWLLGVQYLGEGDLERALELMQPWLEYARETGLPEARKMARRVKWIRWASRLFGPFLRKQAPSS